jgi:hypothetical protein
MERPKKPAITEPAIPIKMVITTPPGSGPGIMSFAKAPTTNPTTIIQSIISYPFAFLIFGTHKSVPGIAIETRDDYLTSKKVSTRVTPATCLALASIAVFSCWLLTGTRKVTTPAEAMIFTLWAFVDSESSATIALRTFAEISMSYAFSP